MDPGPEPTPPGPAAGRGGATGTPRGSLYWVAVAAALSAALALVVAFVVAANRAPLPLEKSVLSNARQLSAAADQYFLEFGVSSVASADLVGATNYVKGVNIIAGESYPDFYTKDVTITVVGVAGTRTVTYAP